MIKARRNPRAPRRNVVAPRLDEDEALSNRFLSQFRGPFFSAIRVLEKAAAKWPREVAAGVWNPFRAIDDLPWDEFNEVMFTGIQRGLNGVFRRSMQKELSENFGLRVRRQKNFVSSPQVPEQLAFDYIQGYGAELVVGVNVTTKNGMKAILEKMVLENKAPAQIAQQLRKGGLGLTPKWAKAVDNRRDKLIAAGIDLDKVEKEVERYRKKLLRARASQVARTESINARNAGIQSAWNVAVSEGELDPLMGKIWLAKAPCPICVELANLPPVPMNKPFISPDIGPIMRPPAHVNCKCGIGLVDIDRKLGPSAQRMREAAQTGDSDLTSATAQSIQEQYLAGLQAKG
jgi:hypothetical protein